ncbi:Serine/threonine-protein kinase [Trametes coccinea BRFM310]|uniref:non-specific serine/threonine protein kinase n=1 Tax=Trametes coccinea (strain BRFM310) TaxID=1353009 RepID=A0A1Y2IG62_TRAC3|nr:Serine/threonine-protein kinase [Trametes coccinea BRFM310]
MDPQVEDRQKEEITALQSIYDKDFTVREAKAWKGAQRLAEFNIRVTYPDPEHAEDIFFYLHTIFPKTYPILACPIFRVEQGAGITKADLAKLEHAVQQEAQKYKGQEMVFQIVTFAQDWMKDHVKPPTEVSGSLAAQMNRRAIEQERARKQREEEEAALEQQRAAELAEQLNEQIRENAYQQQQERERMQQLARKRAMSDATTVGPDETLVEDAGQVEVFDKEIHFMNTTFDRVRLFHSRQEGLGTMFQAEPILEKSPFETIPLELLSVSFMAEHYKRPQGLKKLKELESEIQRLTSVRHPNLVAILAVKLTIPRPPDNPRLVILMEQRPSLTLQDVLEDSDHLREDRATDYLGQMLAGINTLHAAGIIHRGFNLKCIGLTSRDTHGHHKRVKIFNACYHVCLLALHRSNNIGFAGDPQIEDMQIPEGWMPPDAVESTLVYTKGRDVHAAGIVLLQMIMGRDVMDRYPDPQSALLSESVSPFLQQKAAMMLSSAKKNSISCQSLLGDLVSPSNQVPSNMRTPTIPFTGPKTPMVNSFFAGSPETDYFRMPPPKPRHVSRWKEDWEELEILGRGGFGEVVKARNKIDNRIYAVKRIRLRNIQNDKIFREVNALSRLNHRFIVRYYTTWVETTEDVASAVNSDIDSSTSETTDGMTSVPHSNDSVTEDHITTFDMNDLDSPSKHSFPSIHFGSRSGDDVGSDDTSSSDDLFVDQDLFGTPSRPRAIPTNGTVGRPAPPAPEPKPAARTLYIQMEYVERQTLKERITEGLDEQNAWRLFHQILDALVHMSSLGILHRDIKLTNIFIDGKGDCKVGDFGLATSSLAAVDPSDVAPNIARHEEMTLDVGTALYIAPELQSRRKGPRSSAKADMYSLGIVFFEMNYFFKTDSERWDVLRQLRLPTINFPSDWDPRRTKQREIITWLLQHDPDKRPTALELSQSPLLPPRLEDEYVKSAMKLIAKPDSPHLQAVLSTLFSQPMKAVRTYLYDADAEPPEHAALNTLVIDRLEQIFHLHGAVDIEPPLLLPVTNPKDDRSRALFLDRHGEVVMLPNDALAPFARAAARADIKRIKRYHIGDVYHPNVIAGHPRMSKVAVFDIITPDLITGPNAATSEAVSIASECLDNFGNLWQQYEIHLSHARILDEVLEHVPREIRQDTVDILSQTKSSTPQKRSNLLRKGVTRMVNDWLEVLSETYESIDIFADRLERSFPVLREMLDQHIQDIKTTVQFATASGVARPLKVNPLMLNNRSSYYAGVCFEVVRKNKYSDVLATGGRYDELIRLYSPPKPKGDTSAAVAVQIHLDRITAALAAYQSASLRTLLKEQKSFGYWSPRRCDVYVVSYQPGYLTERLEIAAMLWKHNISADVMYEASLRGMVESENYVEQCSREGILFIVHAKPRIGSAPVYKVKSVLKGTETEVSPNELVSFLQQQIAEQKRIDATTSGAAATLENPQAQAVAEKPSITGDTLVVLPGDIKKQRKGTKTVMLNKAHDHSQALKTALPGIRTIAIDVPTTVFEDMIKNPSWLSNEEALRTIATGLPAQYGNYAHQIKDAVQRQKTDGQRFVILYGIRQERIGLLTLN